MSRPIQVMKFGGTSVGDANRIRSAATIAAEASKHRSVVVVVSAMSGITNALISTAEKSAAGDAGAAAALAKTRETRHWEVIRALIPEGEKRRDVIGEIEKLIVQAG